MTNAYILDVFETLADTPGWAQLVESDPKLKELAERAKSDPKSKIEFVSVFDKKVASGELTSVEVPGSRQVLEQLAKKGPLVAYSSGTLDSINGMLEQAGLKNYFTDKRLRISDSDTLKASKGKPEGYTQLMAYLQTLGLEPILFVDNTERNVQAAVQSGVAIPSKYHFDRKASGLLVPEQKDGYVRIASLNQMRELEGNARLRGIDFFVKERSPIVPPAPGTVYTSKPYTPKAQN